MSLPEPRANPDLQGHEGAEAQLLAAFAGGRPHHAWLLTGPAGIGKATLAFRLARHLLANPPQKDAGPSLFGDAPAAEPTQSLYLAPDAPVFQRVVSRGHLDLLVVEREFDEKRGRLRGEITVEAARRIGPFLTQTAAEGGWRIVVIDGAEHMNRSAANAILKLLEEPPAGAILLLVSHNPARLLPTIRSRCRTLALAPLEEDIVAKLLASAEPDLDAATRGALVRLADGSIGRALMLQQNGGLELYGELVALMREFPEASISSIHALAERLGRATEENAYRTTCELMEWWLARFMRGLATGIAPRAIVEGEQAAIARLAAGRPLAEWMSVWETVRDLFNDTDRANLDRRQAMLGALMAISRQ
ncbi:DNA polymerase III subunit delta' [Radicibacter daui]|uniref:DNA polymerase III subunit delta' n=1 Tax=Radicibacter daui TaxID=3064829 RepID=UPI004046E98E